MQNPNPNPNVQAPISLVHNFEQLATKANAKFGRLRDIPAHLVADLSRAYSHAFAAFNTLWQYQQTHRRALVEAGGLKRSDIGEIASKIGHLHFNWYLRCADTRFLLESYVFYEAVHARQYYQDTLLLDSTGCSIAPSGLSSQDSSVVAEQQLMYYARFILVCMMLGKKEEAMNLMQEFQALVAAYSMSKETATTHEWPLVLAEVGALLTADPGMPLPRSPGAALSFRPCCRVWPSGAEAACAPHTPVIHHAVLIGYHHRQVKLAQLPIDMLRMMQALEWMDERLMASEAGITEASGGGGTHPPTTATPTPGPSSSNGNNSLLNLCAMSLDQETNNANSSGSGAASGGQGEEQSPEQRARAGMVGASPEPGGSNRGGGTAGSGTPNQPHSARALQARLAATAAGASGDAAGSSGQRNPPKTLLYRTTGPAALAALHSAAASLSASSQEDVLLLYLGCSSMRSRLAAGPAATYPTSLAGRGACSPQVRLPPVPSTSCLTSSLAAAGSGPACTDASGNDLGGAWCLSPPASCAGGPPGAAGDAAGGAGPCAAECALRAEDLRPLTRRRLVVVADGDVAGQLRSLCGTELVHPVAALMSPRHRPSAFGDATRTGQLFTLFLTLPVSAFCLIMGEHDPSPHTLRALQDAVDESLACIATSLAQALTPSPSTSATASTPAMPGGAGRMRNERLSADLSAQAVWSVPFKDVLLRQLMCRFVLARAALAFHRASTGRPECQPDCVPELPPQVSPGTDLCVEAVHRVAAVIRRQALFEDHANVVVLAGAALAGVDVGSGNTSGLLHAAMLNHLPPHSGGRGAALTTQQLPCPHSQLCDDV